MKFKKIMFVSILLLAILTIGAVSASDENVTDELTVNEDWDVESSTADDSNLEIGDLNDNKLLEDSIRNYSDLSEAIKDTPENGTLELDKDYKSPYTPLIEKPMTIDGKGHSLEVHLYIKADNVTLKNIVFKNCADEYSGGAIYWYGNNATLDNCVFINCSSKSGYGGAVSCHNDATLIDCVFINCSCGNKGGALEIDGLSSLSNCNFINCSAEEYGAVRLLRFSNLSDCNFINCSARSNYVAIYGSYGFNLVNVSFTNCALYSEDPYNCTNVFIDGVEHRYVKFDFKENEVFYLQDSILAYSPISIDANNCTLDGQGNTISAEVYIKGRDVTIRNAIFKNASVSSSARYTTIKNCSFMDSSSLFESYYASILGCRFSGEVSNDIGAYGKITNCSFTNFTGNALSVQSSKITVENCSFVDGSSGRYVTIIWVSSNEVIIRNCSFINCSSGPSIYFGGGGKGLVEKCTFMFISGDSAISAYVGRYDVIESTFVNCSDGAIFIPNNVVNCTFVNCSRIRGGAIYMERRATQAIGCSFLNCVAQYSGGAIYGYDSSCNITNCSFEKCFAGVGNAIYSGSARYCTFINYSNSSDAVYNTEITNCIFKNETGINTTNNNTDDNSTKQIPEIIVPPMDEPSAEGTVTVTLPADATGTVTLTVEGKDYVFDIVNGKADVKLPDLSNGDYPYTITYSGDNKYSSFTNNGSLKVNKTNANPVENQTNSTVNPIDNKTGNNTTENNTSQENTTVVDNSKIVASNVNVVYSAGSYYTIKVYGTDGKLADGVNVKVSGKISKSLTAKNGVAKFKITQGPGTYKITISALGKSVTKTITVKKATPKLTAKAKAFKKSVKNKNYVVTLKTNQNKVMKKAKLTLKVNGKTYSAKTNAKGQATFKITKLTKKGKFTAVVKFAGNKYYNAKTVKPKITVK